MGQRHTDVDLRSNIQHSTAQHRYGERRLGLLSPAETLQQCEHLKLHLQVAQQSQGLIVKACVNDLVTAPDLLQVKADSCVPCHFLHPLGLLTNSTTHRLALLPSPYQLEDQASDTTDCSEAAQHGTTQHHLSEPFYS